MTYLNRTYSANRDANGSPMVGDTHLKVCKGDLFRIAGQTLGGRLVCEMVRADREPIGARFIASEIWLDEFCTYTGIHTSTHTEPPCLCETPSMHNRDCEWLQWKQAR